MRSKKKSVQIIQNYKNYFKYGFSPKILNDNSHFHIHLRLLCCEVLQTILERHFKIFPYSHLLNSSTCMFYNM